MIKKIVPLVVALSMALPSTAAAASKSGGGGARASSSSSVSGASNTAPARQAAKTGMTQDRRFKQEFKSRPGATTNVRMSTLSTKKGAIPDGITKNRRPVELKPDTISGRQKMQSQLRRYENTMGKRGIGVFYDQTGNRRIERTPYSEYKARTEGRARPAEMRPRLRFAR